jgi:hypothetical protein
MPIFPHGISGGSLECVVKFGVATAVCNGRETFRACAFSVRAAADAARLSPRDVVQFVQEKSPCERSVEDIALEAGCDFSCGPDGGIYDGVGKALDRAYDAGAEYLSWLNADEQYLRNALGVAQRIFESNRRISIVFGDYLTLDREFVPRAARREIPARRFYLRNGVNYLMSCTVFFRREVWAAMRPFSPDFRLLADKEFYMRALDGGFRAALATEYIGAFSMTGANASLDFAAASEESRLLRSRIGAMASPLARLSSRVLRVAEKAIHGCYFPEKVSVDVFAPDGTSRPFCGRLSPFWNWRSA